jgi:uncharacterized protein
MQSTIRFLLLCVFIIALDWYFFHALAGLTKNLSPTKRAIVGGVYWSITALALLLLLVPFVYPFKYWSPFVQIYVTSFVVVLALSKIVGCMFLLLDDGGRFVQWIGGNVRTWSAARQDVAQSFMQQPIPRRQFMSNLALIAAAIPFSSLLYGMVQGAFQYRVHRVSVRLPNLPAVFDGFRIAQISDIHIGSFTSTEHLQKAFQMVNAEKPDAIFFTGDLVNNTADETAMHRETLKLLRATHGVFSTIGNHDYGDYMKWDSPEEKKANFEQLLQIQRDSGWTLLMNENRIIERGGEKLAIIGIENWGASLNFPKRGDLKKAYAGAEDAPVKLLLSHDPSHWEAQVRKDFPAIDIAFAGHTHGAQFGVEIPGFHWSPVQYFYKQWAGLYKQDEQYLYVNRGLGFLGYPGRFGIWPEITVMELRRA